MRLIFTSVLQQLELSFIVISSSICIFVHRLSTLGFIVRYLMKGVEGGENFSLVMASGGDEQLNPVLKRPKDKVMPT